MSNMTEIDPGWTWDADFPLSQGLRIGNFVFLSGQVAFDSEGNVVGEGNLREQTRQVFENIKGILTAGGATFQDVVKMTTFFTVDITDHAKVTDFFDVRKEYFGNHKPCSTGVQVTALVDARLMLEVEVVALLHGAK
ncbi:MAG: 2-iminobutanoate/2-iminopropanoate deaminase [Planctomycetota bacterium]|jgi:2-iminobutanoate/2-iminopropanoate deaminase